MLLHVEKISVLKNGSLLKKGGREGASINPRKLGCFQVHIRCHRDALNGAVLPHYRRWKGPELVFPGPGSGTPISSAIEPCMSFCRRGDTKSSKILPSVEETNL